MERIVLLANYASTKNVVAGNATNVVLLVETLRSASLAENLWEQLFASFRVPCSWTCRIKIRSLETRDEQEQVRSKL